MSQNSVWDFVAKTKLTGFRNKPKPDDKEVYIYTMENQHKNYDEICLMPCAVIDRAMNADELESDSYVFTNVGEKHSGVEYVLICKYRGNYYKLSDNPDTTVHLIIDKQAMLVLSDGYCDVYCLYIESRIKFVERFCY